jgi:toxin CptA
VIAHAGALILPFAVPLPWPVYWMLVTVSALSARHAFRMHFGSMRVISAVWDAAGDWHLDLADGRGEIARLRAQSYVSPYLIVLLFASESRRRSLVLLNDSLDADTLRRLRVRMRLEGEPETGDTTGLPNPGSKQ